MGSGNAGQMRGERLDPGRLFVSMMPWALMGFVRMILVGEVVLIRRGLVLVRREKRESLGRLGGVACSRSSSYHAMKPRSDRHVDV